MALAGFTGIKFNDGFVSSSVDVLSAVKAVRREGAMQAARDVLSLLPLVDLHARNHAYFYLEPSTGGAEPKITVYLLEGAVNNGVLEFPSVITVMKSSSARLPTTLPQLVEASQQEVINALLQIGPGLAVEWDDVSLKLWTNPPTGAPFSHASARLLRVGWA